jgi:hypothetical protein
MNKHSYSWRYLQMRLSRATRLRIARSFAGRQDQNTRKGAEGRSTNDCRRFAASNPRDGAEAQPFGASASVCKCDVITLVQYLNVHVLYHVLVPSYTDRSLGMLWRSSSVSLYLKKRGSWG